MNHLIIQSTPTIATRSEIHRHRPTVSRARPPKPSSNLLEAHLRAMLGAWPPRQALDIRVWPGRDVPGWDRKTSPGLGVESPSGTVLSISPSLTETGYPLDYERLREALRSAIAVDAVPAAFGRPDLIFGRSVLRWADHIPAFPEIGVWLRPDDARLPAWVRPFNGDVLAALDGEGHVMAAVGIKRHNRFGHEIAVETEPIYRGRGLARMLVTQAARSILRTGTVPLYLHEPGNHASARVADASGFPDRGWRMIGLYPRFGIPDTASSRTSTMGAQRT